MCSGVIFYSYFDRKYQVKNYVKIFKFALQFAYHELF